jgi:hypothetical protein
LKPAITPTRDIGRYPLNTRQQFDIIAYLTGADVYNNKLNYATHISVIFLRFAIEVLKQK